MDIYNVGPTPKSKRYDLIRSKLTGNVTLKDVLSPSRRADVVAVRHEVWYVMNTEWEFSTVRIGEIWGYDHTSVMNGIRRHRNKINGQPSSDNDSSSDEARRTAT